MRIALALAALLLAPGASLAGKGGGGGGGGGGGTIDGMFYYADKTAFDQIISLANIEQPFDFCFAMRVQATANIYTPNRRYVFEARSLGTIEKQSSNKVVGSFGSVEATLRVYRGATENVNTSPLLFSGTATSFCSLDAQVTKGGAMDKASLWCEFGPEFAAFDIPDFTPDPFFVLPDISREEILNGLEYALAKKKAYKIDTEKGSFGVRHTGLEVVVPDEYMTSLTCPIAPPLED
jgi:hypothetical protein